MGDTCFYHPDKPAVINCFQCTKFICEICRKFSYGYIYCPTCFEMAKCKVPFNTIDKFEYIQQKSYKPKIAGKIFKFLFRVAPLGIVLYGFHNKDFVMNWVFKQGFTKILKNISPEVANLVNDNKISNPIDIVKNPVTELQLQAFAKSLELYKMVYGDYPDNFERFIKSNFESDPGKDITIDSWGKSYRYINKGNSYEVSSAGPDGEFGTSDDITYGK